MLSMDLWYRQIRRFLLHTKICTAAKALFHGHSRLKLVKF